MKKIIFAFIISFASLQINAQFFELGLRAGGNLHHVKIKSHATALENLESNKREMGFHGGVYGRLNFTKLFIQPELLYTFQNGQINYNDNGTTGKIDFEYSRFDVPIIVGAKINKFRFGLGPVATFAISEPDDAFKKSLKDATYGYQIGLGIDFTERFRLELRYEGAFGQSAESVTIGGTEYQSDVRLSQYLFGFGYKLF